MHSRRRAAALSRRARASSARSRSTITPPIIITCSLNSRITRSASWYSAFASSACRSNRSTSGIRLWASTSVKRFAMSRRLTQRGRRRNSARGRRFATPWSWHVPMAVAGMKQGKHVAIEVPAARTMEECWEMVNTSEATQRHCIQLENCCYGYNEMMVLNMVRAGLFGELTHGGAAYNHDLRGILFSNEGEGLWRRAEHFNRDGNLYPTHGLAPVAHYMDINRGDRFDTLVSMSSISAALQSYRREKLEASDPRQKEVYKEGDFNVSLIRTVKGRVIELEHNVSSPQPYDRINLIAGTKGIFRDYPPRVYLDGAKREAFESLDTYKEKYEPALWKKVGEMEIGRAS